MSLISVQAKVIHLGPAVKIDSQKKPLTKQDCMISDSRGTCKLVLWQDNVDKLVVGDSYVLSNLRIAVAQFLSFTVDTTRNTVDDIGEVCVSDKLTKILSITNLLFLEKLCPSYDEHHKFPVCDWKVSMAVPQDTMKCCTKFNVSKAKKQSMAKFADQG